MKRVLLHVGTPKTGTSYLQDVLFKNRDLLVEHGIHYPADRFDDHFLAALDLMRMPWGGLEHEAIGRWDALAERVRAILDEPTPEGAEPRDTTVIISHEILATASRSQAGRALASLGHGAGTEIHLILSVRDLVRQIPAEWQENIKHRSSLKYERFLELIQDPERDSRIGSWFWGVQEIPDILYRWGADLPPEHIHLVTVPPSGSPRELLWDRFSEAFGLDGVNLEREGERANPSLGVPETYLIRKINKTAVDVVAPADYRPLVRELLAHRTLSQRTDSPRLALPPLVHDWVHELEISYVEEIKARGYHVIGDLADLIGTPAGEYTDPDNPDFALVTRAALDAIRALLVENAHLQQDRERLQRELRETQEALERSYLRPTYRAREKIVRKLDDSETGHKVMEVYRRARGRSS